MYGILTAVASLVSISSREHRLKACGLTYLQLLGSRAQAQELWCANLDASSRVGSSQTRDQTHVPCAGRQILNPEPPGKSLYHSFVGGCYLSVMLASGVSGVRREGAEGKDRVPGGGGLIDGQQDGPGVPFSPVILEGRVPAKPCHPGLFPQPLHIQF